jgi:XTP/dITP diphosphohydrolase
MTAADGGRQPSPLRLLVATTNPAKAERLRRCLTGWPFSFYGPEAVPGASTPDETGVTHREVAESKAQEWSLAVQGLAVASDGGLVIPALGGRWDSLRTRRSAGEDATDDDRTRHLLRLMEPFQGEERRALWREAVALADRGAIIAVWETEGPIGYLQSEPSSARIEGFWAASLWHFPEMGKTYTELSPEELRRVGDPWTRLTEQAQEWLRNGGWERLAAIDRSPL